MHQLHQTENVSLNSNLDKNTDLNLLRSMVQPFIHTSDTDKGKNFSNFSLTQVEKLYAASWFLTELVLPGNAGTTFCAHGYTITYFVRVMFTGNVTLYKTLLKVPKYTLLIVRLTTIMWIRASKRAELPFKNKMCLYFRKSTSKTNCFMVLLLEKCECHDITTARNKIRALTSVFQFLQLLSLQSSVWYWTCTYNSYAVHCDNIGEILRNGCVYKENKELNNVARGEFQIVVIFVNTNQFWA